MTRVLLALQALISFASAVALVAFPRLILASVGAPVAPSAFLLCYLLVPSLQGLQDDRIGRKFAWSECGPTFRTHPYLHVGRR